MKHEIESVTRAVVVVPTDSTGLLGEVLQAFLERGEVSFDRTMAGRDPAVGLIPELRVERVGTSWTFGRRGAHVVVERDELVRLFDIAFEMRRMTDARRFPLGETLGGGAFEVVELLREGVDRGQYVGRDLHTAGSVLVTLGGPQSLAIEQLRAALVMASEGVAALRHIGPFDREREHRQIAMVEDHPAGRPASDALTLPLDPALARALAIEVAWIAEDAETPLVGLRPELIYIDGDRVSAVAPRCERFLATVQQQSPGTAACFEQFYLAPEVLANPRGTPDQAADVFSIAAILAQWVTGEHPFESNGPMQAISIATNRRRSWRGPSELAGIVDAGLAPDPADRPLLIELIGALKRAS